MNSKFDLNIPTSLIINFFLITWIAVQHISAFYNCPTSCKCHSRDVFCVGNGLLSMPHDIPWNKTIVYIRNYKMKNETLTSEDIDGNNVTKSLTLQNLGIRDIEDGCFEFFEHVEFLNLNENNLTQLRDEMFMGLQRIKLLHVCKNQLKEIDMTFYHVKTLFVVDFSYNRISNLKWMSELGSNQYFAFARYSHLHTLYGAKLATTSTRISITLSNNPLSDVNFEAEESFRFGIRLILLDVGLQRIPSVSMAISYLDLSHNNILAIKPNDMHNIGFESRNMNDLLLNNNNLATIAPSAFNRFKRLRTLHLENNVLKTIPKYLPSSLYFLYMSNNQVTRIERFWFIGMSNLSHLVLKNNKINTYSPFSFSGLARLQFLFLEGNYISTLPEEGFMGLDSLEMLTLSRNAIQKMESGCFNRLRKLKIMDLSFINNEIDMDEDIFDPLGSLEEFFIQSSPHLTNVLLSSPRALATMKNLRRLDISHNKIITLKSDISMFFPRLISLDISANRWQCNKDAELIIKLVNTYRHVFTHTEIICA